MDIYKLIDLFGKEYRDKELVDFFKQDGFDVIEKIQKWMETSAYKGMESSVYAENINNGYSLHFADELDYLNIEDGKYGESGNYYFTCIHIYAENADGYSGYKDKIINDIKITNTKDEIRMLMQEEHKRHEFLDEDIWNNKGDGYSVYVDYREQNTPFMISISKNI